MTAGEPPVAQQLARPPRSCGTRVRATARSRNSVGSIGSAIEPPRLPRRIVGRGLVELDEVADAPRDRVALALERVLARSPRTPSTRARSRATDGFSAMTSSTDG